METRSIRRKRRNSSGSNAEQSPTVWRGKTHALSASSCVTPRQQTKRVRFSDPGPTTQHIPDYSTGLTPAMCRTSFDEKGDNNALHQTPSRQARRRSTPLPRSRRVTDSPLPFGAAPVERVLHFTPLRQLLDTRTQRRIRRLGLSNEINNLEQEKRAAAHYERSLDSLLRERDSLKQELELAKKEKASPESHSPSDDGEWLALQDQIEHIESGNDRLRAQLSFSVTEDFHRQPTPSDSETDTVMINDSGFEGDTVLMSDSPDMRGADAHHSVPDGFSLSHRESGVDASVQTPQPVRNLDPEFIALSQDLEAAKKEKRKLFEACRSRLDLLDGTALGPHLRQHSPSPDLLDDILPCLMQALTRASDATRTLSVIHDELSSLGFHGANAGESVQELRSRLRAARLELERAVPGETANAGLHDGDSTLSALVKRVEMLLKDLGEERRRHHGSADRERALRGQFDTLLVRYETASNKIQGLEDSIASSAGDMLHTRMRMQELEREAQEQVIGIDRLNSALSKYHGEVKGLEALVTRLEDEKSQRNDRHAQQVSELERKVAQHESARRAADSTIAEREKQIRELEEDIEQNRIRVCDLIAEVEIVEREHHQGLKQSAAEHEQEMGLMNVRVSELNTALEAAKADAEKLRSSSTGLEEQLRLEIQERDGLLDKWVEEQTRAYASMKAAVSAERRKAKVRTANWEMKSDELQLGSMGIGSEPITPVSMTRFVDVEVGRGKHRRRLDSGVGILTEDELEDELLPSDPADL
ncbi:hypothetical protein BDW59DRAFT_149406 [Aspergillus cavernicola]|uniref:Uncharacterized protein n=1 Tax=Aspergillus cavernicola TaxID=176166 RepID=A0ABR4I526_9EURO